MSTNQNVKFRLSDDDLAMLSAFVKSPVASAVKRLIAQDEESCRALMLSESDHLNLIRLQGRIQGLKVIENLPQLIVAQHEQRQLLEASERAAKNQIAEKQKEDFKKYSSDMSEKRANNRAMIR